MKSAYLQLFMDNDLALKYTKEKAIEVEQLQLDLETLHPSSYIITSHSYMYGNIHSLME